MYDDAHDVHVAAAGVFATASHNVTASHTMGEDAVEAVAAQRGKCSLHSASASDTEIGYMNSGPCNTYIAQAASSARQIGPLNVPGNFNSLCTSPSPGMVQGSSPTLTSSLRSISSSGGARRSSKGSSSNGGSSSNRGSSSSFTCSLLPQQQQGALHDPRNAHLLCESIEGLCALRHEDVLLCITSSNEGVACMRVCEGGSAAAIWDLAEKASVTQMPYL